MSVKHKPKTKKDKVNGHASTDSPDRIESVKSEKESQEVHPYDVAGDEYRSPVPRRGVLNHVIRKGRKYEFYSKVRWDDWWDEFANGIDSQGNPKHASARQFAIKKGKGRFEQEVIKYCIGPKPEVFDRYVPWLGDWDKRRRMGFWSLDDPDKFKSLQATLNQKKSAIEKLEQLAPFTIKDLARFEALSSRIDELFSHQPVLKTIPATSPKNVARFKIFMDMQERVFKMKTKVQEQYLKLHGLSPTDMEHWLKIALQMVGQAGAAGALTGAMAGQSNSQFLSQDDQGRKILVLDGEITPTHLLLAQTMAKKSDIYNMPIEDTGMQDMQEAPTPKNGHDKKNGVHKPQ